MVLHRNLLHEQIYGGLLTLAVVLSIRTAPLHFVFGDLTNVVILVSCCVVLAAVCIIGKDIEQDWTSTNKIIIIWLTTAKHSAHPRSQTAAHEHINNHVNSRL